LQQSELEALAFACRHSFITNKLEYCGEEGAFREFKEFIEAPVPEKAEHIKELLSTFEGFHAYLKLIGKSNNMQPFDFRVIEAYWLGNRLLENVGTEKVRQMILTDLSRPGLLPKSIAEKKADSLTGEVFPHHSFHVLYMNFMTKKVEPILKNLDNCLVGWGKVKELHPEKEKIVIEGVKLTHFNNEFQLDGQTKSIGPGLLKELKKGAFISVHWNNAVSVLSEEQLSNLRKYTKKNVEYVNSL